MQSVNPYSSSKAEQIQSVFLQASYVKFCKSDRSTYEINRFTQRISPNPDLIAIERHGEVPQVVPCRDAAEEVRLVSRLAGEFSGPGFKTLGIICKTEPQAERLHAPMSALDHRVHLLTGQSASFVQGVTICTASMAKGLEFDQVIVPDMSERNYNTAMDRNLLYVAARAPGTGSHSASRAI